jgi:hypothetical protein
MNFIFCSFLFFCSHSFVDVSKDCYDAFYSAGFIYIYSGKAYTSDNYEDLEYYVSKALNAAEDCMYYAEVCDCWNAYYSADEAYRNLEEIYCLSEKNDALQYIKKAMNNAEDAIKYADECNQGKEE